jgi:hypothetical protein
MNSFPNNRADRDQQEQRISKRGENGGGRNA